MSRPNILFVMTDQQRWDAVGCSSTDEPWLETPAFDRLASEGTRFTNCVTTTPICIPARVILATGHYPHNNAVRVFDGDISNIADAIFAATHPTDTTDDQLFATAIEIPATGVQIIFLDGLGHVFCMQIKRE